MNELKKIRSWDELPVFESDAEAAPYWETHGLAPHLLEEASHTPPAEVAAILSRRPVVSRPKAVTAEK